MAGADVGNTADFVVVGGGLSGCVIASRLKQRYPNRSIVLLEAGQDEHANPVIQNPWGGFGLAGTSLMHNYDTVPQRNLDGRQIQNNGGKVLSGGSAVNYGTWTRGGAIG